MPEETQVVLWLDAAGKTWLQVIQCVDESTDAIVDAIQVVSNAGWVWRVKGTPERQVPIPSGDKWPGIDDFALIPVGYGAQSTTPSGFTAFYPLAIEFFEVPAPQGRIFLADGVTVDVSVEDVQDLYEALFGHLRAPSGNAVSTSFGAALRHRLMPNNE